MLKLQRNRFRNKGLGLVAASLPGIGASTAASAAIVSDLTSTHSVPTTFQLNGDVSGQIDLVAMAGMGSDLDLELEAAMGMGMDPSSTVGFDALAAGMGMDETTFLNLRSAGDTVDGSLAFEDTGQLVSGTTVNPGWSPGTTGYTGFTFNPDSTTPLYGWMQVEFDAGGTTFSVTQWAYEDTGAAITVADTGLPECGDGAVEGSEECDDGGTAAGDGCSSTCQYETGPCDDGLFCNTGETWSLGVCGGGSAIDCSASSDTCNLGTCDEFADACSPVPANEGGVCDDFNAATLNDQCVVGACVGQEPAHVPMASVGTQMMLIVALIALGTFAYRKYAVAREALSKSS